MIPSAWLKGLFGFLVKGNGIGDGTEYVHANQVILSDGVTGNYDELNRIVTVTSEGAGSTGPAGAGYYATSATSTLISAAEKTFTTQSGLAYIAGPRARVVSAADSANWMEGEITGYTGTTLVIDVDAIGGSGTHTDWRISLGGSIGPTGGSGPTGPGYLATSTTTFTPAGASANVALTTQSGLAYAAGDKIRVTSQSDAFSWSEGTVVSYTGSTFTFTDETCGLASVERSDWTIALRGATGATGAGVAATSTTSRTIASGAPLTFVVQSGLAYFPGMRLRLISRANTANWMEGELTVYAGSTIAVYIDRIGGSGAHADWDISVAGDVGATGATGPTGVSTFGPFGYTAGSSGSTAPGWCSTNTGADLYNQVGSWREIVEVQMPRAGTLTGWSVHHGTAVSMNIDYDIFVNGVGLELYLPVLGTERDGSQTMLDIPFNRGDLIAIEANPGSAAYAKIYLEVTWTP